MLSLACIIMLGIVASASCEVVSPEAGALRLDVDSAGKITADSGLPVAAYGVEKWAYNYGNHRAVVTISQNSKAVRVFLPWRRRDDHPERKDVIVRDHNNHKINNRLIIAANREYGEVVFEPTTGVGVYYLYYFPTMPLPKELPHIWSFPMTRYFPPHEGADKKWLSKCNLPADYKKLPEANLVEFQSRSDFHSFYPMEIIATRTETEALRNPQKDTPFILIPEDRKYPIRMTEDLPARWVKNGISDTLKAVALKNEYYAFQIGVWAQQDLSKLQVAFTDLKSKDATIPASHLNCMNMGGKDWRGQPFTKEVNVQQDLIQPLWMGIDIPEEAKPGIYKGEVLISAQGCESRAASIELTIKDQVLEDKGDADIWKHSRLRWLNSTIGLDNDLVAPFTEVEYSDNTISILGRKIKLSDNGIPTGLQSFIDMYAIKEKGREILRAPIQFVIETDQGIETLGGGTIQCLQQDPGLVQLQAVSRNKKVQVTADITAEMDGYLRYRLTVNALNDIKIVDARLEIPFRKEVARYYKLTQNRPGGYIPESFDIPVNAGLFVNGVWIGDYNAGLCFKPKNDDDEWNMDRNTQNLVPIAAEWDNQKQGRYLLNQTEDTALFKVTSGKRVLKSGDEFRLNFAFLVTPFKPIKKEHWRNRYYHEHCGSSPQLKKAPEATVINAHHGGQVNPWINYPFLTTDKLRNLTDTAHEQGKRIKLYYTVREQSNRTVELWALRSLDHELLLSGEGYREMEDKDPLVTQKSHLMRNGDSWNCEHLVTDYRNRWHQPIEGYGRELLDGSIGTQGLSRLHNYYLEGLSWLAANIGIDGLYLDGIGYDRSVMKRLRKSLIRANPRGLIDLHERPFPYMEHFPYLDSLWFGEAANYHLDPAYWLVEVSGIPFGLTGEMLKHNASNHRGLIYGMVKRHTWSGDPTETWQWFDRFDIENSDFLGFWRDDCPVKTDNEKIKATAYVHRGNRVAMALASWAEKTTEVNLTIDWQALGLAPQKVIVKVPNIQNLQTDRDTKVTLGQSITLKPNSGVLFEIHSDL